MINDLQVIDRLTTRARRDGTDLYLEVLDGPTTLYSELYTGSNTATIAEVGTLLDNILSNYIRLGAGRPVQASYSANGELQALLDGDGEVAKAIPQVLTESTVYLGGISSPVPTLNQTGVVKRSGSNKLRSHMAKAFRDAGGLVACYYYGEWRQYGISYNKFPWKWFLNHQDKLPIMSVPLPSYSEWRFSSRTNLGGWTPGNAMSSIVNNNLRLISTGSDPILLSPLLNIESAEIPSITIVLNKISGVGWDGKMYFITTTDSAWNASKCFSLTEPTWDGTMKSISVPLSGNAIWTNGKISQVRFDLGADITSVYDIASVSFGQSNAAKTESERVIGLPSDQAWAVNWEIKTAYDHGIDVFVHNFYWNNVLGIGNYNHQKYSLDLHAASTVRPMKFAIQWSNQDSTSPIVTTADLNAMLDEWYSYFNNSRYWRIDNKPVVYIFSLDKLRTWMQPILGASAQEAGKTFVNYVNNYLMSKPSSVCPNGVFLVAEGTLDHPFWWGGNAAGTSKAYAEYSGFNAGTRYNHFSAYTDQIQTHNTTTGVSAGTSAATYPTKLDSYEKLREVHRKSHDWCINSANPKIPFWGTAMAGWDKRPWHAYQGGAFSESWNCVASSSDFTEHLTDVRDVILNAKVAGKYSWTPVVNLFAWNEFGEGGYICPTRRYGFSLAESILEVFGEANVR